MYSTSKDESVYRAVRTEFLNVIQVNISIEMADNFSKLMTYRESCSRHSIYLIFLCLCRRCLWVLCVVR